MSRRKSQGKRRSRRRSREMPARRKPTDGPASAQARRWPVWVVIILVATIIAGGAAAFVSVSGSKRVTPNVALTSRWQVPDPSIRGALAPVATLFSERRGAVLDHPESADAWGRLGMLFDAHDFYDDAVKCYRHARELAPKAFRWAYHLAQVRDRQGAGPDEVAERFRDVIALAPTSPVVAYRFAEALARQGRLDEAQAAYRRALALDENLAVARRGLGQVLMRLGETAEAVEQLERAVGLGAEDKATYAALAQGYTRLGDPTRAHRAADRAQDAVDIATVDDPHRAEVTALLRSPLETYRKAEHAIDAGDYDRAIEHLRRVIELLPRDPYSRLWLALAYLRIQRYDAAAGPFEEALRLRQYLDDAPIAARTFDEAIWDYRIEHLGRTTQLGRGPMLEQAVSEFELAAAETPNLVPARGYLTLGNAYLEQGRAGRALDQYRQAAEKDPSYANAHYNCGVLLERLGRYGEATAAYARAVDIDPHHAAADRLAALRGGG